MKADVHGSCVSFNILKKDTEYGVKIKLKELDTHLFFSHANIAGSIGGGISVPAKEEDFAGTDAHHARNLKADLNKEVIPVLLESDAEWLLVDFYDFARIQWAYRNGSFTHVMNLDVAAHEYYEKIKDQIEGAFRWIDLPKFLLHEKMNCYFDQMVEKYGRDHIILNRINLSRYYINKDGVLCEIPASMDYLGSYKDNKEIRKLEDYVIDTFGIRSVDVAKYFFADENVNNDILAVHYEEEYYHIAGRIIGAIIKGENVATDKLDMESLQYKLHRLETIQQAWQCRYISEAEPIFSCYGLLDELLQVLTPQEIVDCREIILELYDLVGRHAAFFDNPRILNREKQEFLIKAFEKLMG